MKLSDVVVVFYLVLVFCTRWASLWFFVLRFDMWIGQPAMLAIREVDWPPVSVRSRNSAFCCFDSPTSFFDKPPIRLKSVSWDASHFSLFFQLTSCDWLRGKTQKFANFCVCAVLYRDHWTQGPMVTSFVFVPCYTVTMGPRVPLVTSFMVTLAMNKTNTHCCLYIYIYIYIYIYA